MLDLALYDRIRLHPRPLLQRVIADGFLRFDYRKIELIVEGAEKLHGRPVVIAMNHTDNFNYWPFQYHLHRTAGRYTATWVKGKNFEQPVVSAFMRSTNNIPVASRGYVITRDFLNVMGRRPSPEEYRALRGAVDGLAEVEGEMPRALLERERDILGRPFRPKEERYADAIEGVMRLLMGRFVGLNEEAHRVGLHLLVFPQGTRSVRLSRGHIGLAQMALHLKAPIVPVGCNGCDLVYPGRSPITKPGRVVYRVGEPMEDWGDLAPEEPFVPFTREAEEAHRERFQGVVDRVMERINDLLDERHRFSADRESEGSSGSARFL